MTAIPLFDRERMSGTNSAGRPGKRASLRPHRRPLRGAVSDALDVLDALCDQADSGVTELVRRTGLLKNKVFRVLLSLADREYVEQDPDSRRYRLGRGILALSLARSRHGAGFAESVRPALHSLLERCNETVLVGVVHDERVLIVDLLETTRNVRVDLSSEGGISACRSCLEKITLAYGAPGADAPLEERAHGRGRESPAGKGELGDVRRRGYAVEEGDPGTDTQAVAVPLLDHQQRLVGGICVLAPAERLSPSRILSEIGPAVLAAGSEASRRLREAVDPAPLASLAA